MRKIGDPAFFRTIDQLIDDGNPGLKLARWKCGGADWSRERHSFNSAEYGFGIDVFTISHPGKTAWLAVIVKEHWWSGTKAKSARNSHWAQLSMGTRKDFYRWVETFDRTNKQ